MRYSNIEINEQNYVKSPDRQIRLWHDEGLKVAAEWLRLANFAWSNDFDT
jgi:hypothetical protein